MNQNKDIVIIGCGAGGGTAAQFARKTNRKSSITVFEKSQYPQYSKCGLPHAISGKIPEFKDLIEFSEEWFKKAKINLSLDATVKKIDVKNQLVVVIKEDDEVEKSYDSLVISTGARPFIPLIKYIYDNNDNLVSGVFSLRNIDDAEQISSNLEGGKKAAIIGAGLIGLETADSFHQKGLKVTVIEALPSILANSLDKDMASIIQGKISKHVTFFLDHYVTKIKNRNGKIEKVILKNNKADDEKTIDCDLLVIATGSRPEVSLAKDAGCKIGETGGIVVNEKSETNFKNIYSVGDCTEYKDFVLQKPVLVGLGSIAVRQGIAAGINAAGGDYKLPLGVLQTRTSKFFGIETAAVGPTTKRIHNLPVLSGKYKGMSLPSYFPGGKPITVKVITHGETGCILAAQAVGSNAAQRINTFACAILNQMNNDEFRKLETAYAPPVAPTLDAVTLASDIVAKKINHKD